MSLQWTYGCICLLELVFWVSSDKYPEAELLGPSLSLVMTFALMSFLSDIMCTPSWWALVAAVMSVGGKTPGVISCKEWLQPPMAWECPQAGCGEVSGNQQDWANNISQVDGDSDTVPFCQLCRLGAQQRNKGFCQQFCLAESFPSSPRPDAGQFRVQSANHYTMGPGCQTIQFLPIYPWHLLSCCPSLGAQSNWVSLCIGPLIGMPGT